jgi:type IV pilus assembly protein PilW
MKKQFPRGLSRSRQRGISLMEILIGVALSLLLLSAVAYVFVGSSANYRQQESSSAVQESGRIALEYMGRDIRMTGNPGCGNVGYLNHLSPLLFTNDLVLAAAPGATAADPDGITTLRGSAESAVVDAFTALDQFDLVSTGTLGAVAAGDVLLLSDCSSTDVMTVTAVSGNSITGSAVSKQYQAGTAVMRLETIVYTVVGGELMRNGQAVVGSVNNLKLFYGIPGASGRSALSYVASPTAAQLAEAVAVKVSLTVAEGLPAVSQTYSSTITLRNRAP